MLSFDLVCTCYNSAESLICAELLDVLKLVALPAAISVVPIVPLNPAVEGERAAMVAVVQL